MHLWPSLLLLLTNPFPPGFILTFQTPQQSRTPASFCSACQRNVLSSSKCGIVPIYPHLRHRTDKIQSKTSGSFSLCTYVTNLTSIIMGSRFNSPLRLLYASLNHLKLASGEFPWAGEFSTSGKLLRSTLIASCTNNCLPPCPAAPQTHTSPV